MDSRHEHAGEVVVMEDSRPRADGKFLYVGDAKLDLRGVTYGTFRPRPGSGDWPSPDAVRSDFASMAAAGINSVRTYLPPPVWLLDSAAECGLRVLAGLPWEQHVAFLESRSTARSIEARVREGARACAGHPALLGFAVGNEIPGPIARWYGHRRIERFIERLYKATKEVDPDSLVTYVNYPTTEYLDLPFLDFACFNVYLEAQQTLEAYIQRLHNLVGVQPLVMAEIGLDSRRNGDDLQAETLEWQVDTAFRSSCAGAFVFAWTDEWHRGGHDVDDWDFGIVDRQRRPKPALSAVAAAFERAGDDGSIEWPRVSVVVCTYNGGRWLPGCLEALARVEYPDFEVIVVDDGSSDRSAEIAAGYDVQVVHSQENGGLSSARNLGLEAATGQIVAYLDDDARAESPWLKHLALAFEKGDYAAVGGPNVPPPNDGFVADCVARAPGGPVHVLATDEVAEHIPGCNMAFRRECLEAIGGFDQRYRIAGDDVDICWRLQRLGLVIGFTPGAAVWHHRRNSVKTYVKQQYEYGKAEGLLEQKWPERYNRAGHLSWTGRVYGPALSNVRRSKIRYGTWGSRLFQSVYQPAEGLLTALPMMPEWYLMLAALTGLGALGALWTPLLGALLLLCLGFGASVSRAFVAARLPSQPEGGRLRRAASRALTTALTLAQPLARLAGRLRYGLSPWRRRYQPVFGCPRPRHTTAWSENWASVQQWLAGLEIPLQGGSHSVVHGGEFDRWDLQVRGGVLGVVRLLMVLEEHGEGKQLARFRTWPKPSRGAVALGAVFATLAIVAGLDGALSASLALAASTLAVAGIAFYDCSSAAGIVARSLEQPMPSVQDAEQPTPSAPDLVASQRAGDNGASADSTGAGAESSTPVGVGKQKSGPEIEAT